MPGDTSEEFTSSDRARGAECRGSPGWAQQLPQPGHQRPRALQHSGVQHRRQQAVRQQAQHRVPDGHRQRGGRVAEGVTQQQPKPGRGVGAAAEQLVAGHRPVLSRGTQGLPPTNPALANRVIFVQSLPHSCFFKNLIRFWILQKKNLEIPSPSREYGNACQNLVGDILVQKKPKKMAGRSAWLQGGKDRWPSVRMPAGKACRAVQIHSRGTPASSAYVETIYKHN